MRNVCGLLLAGLVLFGSVVGLRPERIDFGGARIGGGRDVEAKSGAPPLQLNGDKTLIAETDYLKRGGTWTFNPEKREITLNVGKSEMTEGGYWDAAVWTAYISKDGTALNFYSMEASMIESVKGNTGKDPGTILRKY